MKPRISIKLWHNLELGKWLWYTYLDEVLVERCRTNNNGEGLWTWSKSPSQWYADGSPFYEWHQVCGTCQFWLSPNRKAAWSKIRRRYNDDWYLEMLQDACQTQEENTNEIHQGTQDAWPLREELP
jgi:hypothetical protein